MIVELGGERRNTHSFNVTEQFGWEIITSNKKWIQNYDHKWMRACHHNWPQLVAVLAACTQYFGILDFFPNQPMVGCERPPSLNYPKTSWIFLFSTEIQKRIKSIEFGKKDNSYNSNENKWNSRGFYKKNESIHSNLQILFSTF